MNATTTAVGPLDTSSSKAIKIEKGGTIAPTKIAIKNTRDTLFASNIPIEAGKIRKAKVKTSPTNLVVSEIPTPTVR